MIGREISELRASIESFVDEIGETVKHRRLQNITSGYDATKTYQTPTTSAYSIDEDIFVKVNIGKHNLANKESGIYAPSTIRMIAKQSADLKTDDIIIRYYGTASEEKYKIKNVEISSWKSYPAVKSIDLEKVKALNG